MAIGASHAHAQVKGLVTVPSAHSVSQTQEKLLSALESKGMTVMAEIDHAASAAKVGEALRPTVVVIFGNPKAGTPLMQCMQSVGIDLPQKALIWQDEDDKVWLGYNDPAYLAERHNLSGAACEELISKTQQALKAFASAATQD